MHIERDTSYSFARIYCAPMAGVENFGEVMVLDPREAIQIPEQVKAPAATGNPVAKSAAKRRLKKE